MKTINAETELEKELMAVVVELVVENKKLRLALETESMAMMHRFESANNCCRNFISSNPSFRVCNES
jgi:hypothetical protein